MPVEVISAEAAPPAPLNDRQVFRIGELGLAARFDVATELSEMPTVFRLPGSSRSLIGVVNLHGNVAPVFRLHDWLGVSPLPGVRPMMMVFGLGTASAGVVIDGLPSRRKFTAANETWVPNAPQHAALLPFVVASWPDGDTGGDRTWLELDFSSIFRALTSGVEPQAGERAPELTPLAPPLE
jgi:chemotaxis signal transduction protein